MFGNKFIRTDDGIYIVENTHVQAGFVRPALEWAFNIGYAGNWHPLTWMSHMLDFRLFGLNPTGHHAVNLLLHIASTILLYLVLDRATRSQWKSAFVAALFAVHPLHVESVAWAAERKDVLSTLFWMLTMWAYVRYAERPNLKRYAPVFAFMALGLMAKQMLVTLPFVLLLLDYWPLRRLQTADNRRQAGLGKLVIEKVPLFLLSAAGSVMAFLAQRNGNALPQHRDLAFGWQISNAMFSYVRYLAKMVYPTKLAFFYPLGIPHSLGWGGITSAGLVIAATVAVIMVRRRHPYLIVGWLWFVGTMVPVIGLVQVGAQAIADRYTYVPSIGFFMMVAWGVPAIMGVWECKRKGEGGKEGKVESELHGAHSSHPPTNTDHRKPNTVMLVAACLVIAAFCACTFHQVGYWHDDFKLCGHAIRCTERNHMAHGALGMALAEQRKYDEAIRHYRLAIEYAPSWSVAYDSLGAALMETGKYVQAETAYRTALWLTPSSPRTLDRLGVALAKQGKFKEAVRVFQKSVRLDRQQLGTYLNLGKAYTSQGKIEDAMRTYYMGLAAGKAAGTPPNARGQYAVLHNSLGTALAYMGKLDEAVRQHAQAIQMDTSYARAYSDLGRVLALQGKTSDAADAYTKAIWLQSDDPVARNNLGSVLLAQGDVNGAIERYKEAVRIAPQFEGARRNLDTALSAQRDGPQSLVQATRHLNRGNLFQSQRKISEAISEYEAAIRARPSLAEAHGSLAIAYMIRGDYAFAWREVHLCRKYGLQMPPNFISDLSRRMPEPRH